MLHVKLNIQRFAAVGEIAYSVLSQDVGSNTSVVRITFTVRRTSGSTYFSDYKTATITCDGQTGYASINLPSNKTSNSCYVDFTVGHGADGTKSISFSGSVATGTSSGTVSASGSATLPTIPRYANITSFTVAKRDETSVTINFTVDAACDWVWASIDNGATWFNAGGSGSWIGGLTANTGYNFKIKVRRQDSQLTTESGTYYQTTYDYPKATVADFTIGGATNTINLYNPLARQVSAQVISNVDDSVIATYSGTGSGDISSIVNTNDAIDSLYETIPNNPSGTYYVKVTYLGSVKNSESKTYTVNPADCKPDMSVVGYEDVYAKTLNLTGDDQTLILGYSTIQVTIPANNKATAKKYASIVGYKIENGEYLSPMVDEVEGEDVVLTCTATSGIINIYAIDSRGQSGIYQIADTTTINYENISRGQYPTVQRTDAQGHTTGVGEYTKIYLKGQYWNDTFGSVTNSIKSITYSYYDTQDPEHPQTGTTQVTATTSDGNYTVNQLILGDTQEGFDVANSYIISVTVSDELSSTTFTLTLASGTPHIAFSRNGVSIMGKYDESVGGLLQVGGQPMLDMFYPVGSYYETSDGNFNPNTAWGGTWVEDTAGRFTVSRGHPSANASNTFGAITAAQQQWTFSLGDTMGAYTHTLTAAEVPPLYYSITTARPEPLAGGWYDGQYIGYGSNADVAKRDYTQKIETNAGGGAHYIMNPNIVVVRWHRIA